MNTKQVAELITRASHNHYAAFVPEWENFGSDLPDVYNVRVYSEKVDRTIVDNNDLLTLDNQIVIALADKIKSAYFALARVSTGLDGVQAVTLSFNFNMDCWLICAYVCFTDIHTAFICALEHDQEDIFSFNLREQIPHNIVDVDVHFLLAHVRDYVTTVEQNAWRD